jgi:hypothetical protein
MNKKSINSYPIDREKGRLFVGLEYILINQYKRHVEVYQRVRDWQQELYIADQVVQFDLEMSLDAIYKGVL